MSAPVSIHKISKPVDPHALEMVFGRPSSSGGSHPDVHHVLNENKNKETILTINKPTENDSELTHSSQPLLEPDKERPKPPLAGPEIDDLDDEYHTDTTASFPGIDDGLLEPNNNKTPDIHSEGEGEKHEGPETNGLHPAHDHEHDPGKEDGKWPWVGTDEPDISYDGLSPRFGIDVTTTSPGSVLDVNTYQQKKNLAQGMMDLALLSANANQLRYVLEFAGSHPYYYPSLTFISMSIIIQIAVGVGLIMNSRYNVTDDDHKTKADNSNNFIVLGVFLITIINVFITSFSIAPPPVQVAQVIAPGSVIQQAG